MWKKFHMPEELLKVRADDPGYRRWAHNVTEGDREDGVVIRGYANDAGVAANYGRSGAAGGPWHFRKSFYRMPSLNNVAIRDMGDMVHDAQDVAECHRWARENLSVAPAALTVSLGGGHDWAAVDFDVSEIQIVHVDTHLDVRPYTEKAIHSGMPFRYLVEKGARIWCFGAQPEYHSTEHWDYAQGHFEGVASLDDMVDNFDKAIDRCMNDIHADKPLALSIDMDAFPQALSPGVSAPSPRGLEISHVSRLIDLLSKNLSYVGIYELNPNYDRDDQSARLGAYFLARLLQKKF